jgi:hypothetical protein
MKAWSFSIHVRSHLQDGGSDCGGSAAGAGAEVDLRRVPETLSEEVLRKMGAFEGQKAWEHIRWPR